MSNKTSKQTVLPRVRDFYEGKSVFLTGATGYLGVVLLEALLRLCPGIERIYLLVREKKGSKPEYRKESIFSKPVFCKLKEENPDVLKKVYVVPGDVSQPDLGMDEIGLLKVIQNADIVFHCAASISFLRPLKYIMIHNSAATQNVIGVCRKLRNLDALVYTSTAFANCNRHIEIEEEIYRLPFKANKFLDELYNGKEESLQKLVSQCQPPWPNHYTFSKCLAENLIQENAADLPVAIVRPSLIASIWKEPLPGYVEDTSGITALSVGVGKGFIKVLHGDPEVKFDFIPVDIAAHTHILAAMKVALDRSSPPLVVNCTSFTISTLRDYTELMLQLVKRHPLPNTFRTPTTLHIEKSSSAYWIVSLFEHHLPALVFDFLLKMTGSKIRLGVKYRFVDAAIKATNYFMANSWSYKRDNFQKLVMDMHPEDQQVMETHCNGAALENMAEDIAKSAPFFNWASDKKSVTARQKSAKQRYLFTIFIQYTFVAAVCFFAYMTFSNVFQHVFTS